MSTHEQTRRAHRIVDALKDSRILSSSDVGFLRSFLPELPKQKTLEEITEHVRNAWVGASGNEWAGNSYNTEITLESWLGELYVQLQGLKDTPAAEPENVAVAGHFLPAGMRLADHAAYGRVVVSPVVDDDGTCKIFHLSTHARDGSDFCWAPIDSLTFIDYEPAKYDHPEFLETEADYQNAPEGTIVARDSINPWVKEESVWVQGSAADATVYTVPCLKGPRRVLRWGGKE